ncbi:ATPase-like, ATP-binding domain protein [Moelleriella libera RCEF 2490]|uniref:histidine kinase n=1 Tax=Moelleriella libera RCEF 2490 TaxID=1081109 RepID=A0A168CE92_9HYPO|nr:ATPase-like, ATP-binding domain protein [Moelleriella libera RCEF 2490]
MEASTACLTVPANPPDHSLLYQDVDGDDIAEALEALQEIRLLQLLELDRRPTFVVNLNAALSSDARGNLQLVYCNPSLRSDADILRRVSVLANQITTPDLGFELFRKWALGRETTSEQNVPFLQYAGRSWSHITLENGLRIVSANGVVDQNRTFHNQDGSFCESNGVNSAFGAADGPMHSSALAELHSLEFGQQNINRLTTERIFCDWTSGLLLDEGDEHKLFARSVDWSSTPLGPMDNWDWDLRSASDMTMRTPYPAAMYWGPEFITMYNAPYVEIAGQKHPDLMGKPYAEGWSEIWEEIKPVIMRAWNEGVSTMKHDDRLFIMRSGFLEETFFSWSMVPLLGSKNQVMGLFNAAFENTQQIVNERRLLTLREIGEQTAAAKTFRDFWRLTLKGLEFNEYDVPFCLIYSVGDDNESDCASFHSGSVGFSHNLTLEGSLGMPESHPSAPLTLDSRSQEGFAPHMRQSMAAGGVPILLSKEDRTLPAGLVEGLEWRGFGDPCRHLVVFPVNPVTAWYEATYPRGFIVLGVNPRRPYDSDYKLFVHLLVRQLATSLASVVLFEEEVRRSASAARQAAIERENLSLQLQLRTQEAVESEYRFSRLAEFAPVGIFIADFDGCFSYCNDMWWQISRQDRREDFGHKNAWIHNVMDADRPALQAAWNKMLADKSTMSIEFRFKCSQRIGDGLMDTWVLMSAHHDSHQHDSKESIFGCITDISIQKRAERVQSDRRKEAVELKRQQENFIDITSHEMRNPLSAILQCVDQITSSFQGFSDYDKADAVKRLHADCLDAANTVSLCASHQKRIVDDILTLSKLDSKLITVTPVDVQPLVVVEQVLKMFQPEVRAHDISLTMDVAKSYHDFNIDWVSLDPSRLSQVLINFITNSIKFTQGQDKRDISVTLKAFSSLAGVKEGGIMYLEPSEFGEGVKFNHPHDHAKGKPIFLHFTIQDSGSGIGDEDLKLLFRRFQQATPRTHVQYGGSGLGLFISRTLVEMQGGQIGVSSRKDKGSSFYFFIQCPQVGKQKPAANEEAGAETKPEASSKIAPQGKKQNRVVPSPASPTNAASQVDSPKFNVLIVEDNLINQKVLNRQLINGGHKTHTANHGQEALSLLEKSRFWSGRESEGFDISVILMDLEMPVMDGLTCAKRIRELEREGTIVKHIPIIAVTAYARPEQVQKAQDAGMDEVIPKPFRMTDLIPKIADVVARFSDG